MMAAEVSNMTYNHVDVPRRVPRAVASPEQRREARAACSACRSITSRAFARFVQKLEDTPDGDGSMLDHSLIVYGSNMSNSNAHDHFPLPMALVGGGCGKVKGGQHLRYPDRTPVSNLLLTVLQSRRRAASSRSATARASSRRSR